VGWLVLLEGDEAPSPGFLAGVVFVLTGPGF
jgi:hypothetical protein